MDVNGSSASPSWAEYASSKLPSSNSTTNSALYLLALLAMVSVFAAPIRNRLRSVEIYPVINTTKEEYLKEGKALLARGAKEYGGKPFRVYTGQGTLTVLAPEFVHDVKNDERLSSTEFLLAYWQAGTPGFEPYISSGSELIREMIRTRLTPGDVAKLSQPLADEAAGALRDVFTDNEEWHEITLASAIPQIVARVSALVFLGPELCRDPVWLDITINYPSKAMAAAKVLRSYPSPIRRLVHWFLPCCRELRRMLRMARLAIEPIQRRRREQEAGAGGAASDNALAWIEKLASRQKDSTAQTAAFQQLGLSILANASSTDLISQNILDLCRNPELIEPLRDEVLRETSGGWKTSSLYGLRLMDSVLKETLRLKPIASVALGRQVMEDGVSLSDGSMLPRTTGVAVSSAKMWDPEIYPRPETFDGYRFLRMRESGNNEHVAQLASVSPEHLGFGLGPHACPGRFLGSNSAKLIMSYILLRYEFKLADDIDAAAVDPVRFGFSTLANPRAKVWIRRRKDTA
ncbi:cytochrome P450 [Colletotrichum tabaci]|uniref:Cytochrome P450 n=1 Tax=Colletotrichum tabaci TaxID=1209068 RepID=A0AAV9SVJ1_9PEZI